MAAVAAVAALLVILLIQGCMSEHAKTSDSPTTPVKSSVVPTVENAAVEPASPVPASTLATLPPNPVTTVAPLAPATVTPPAPASSQAELVYVVKPGDTLSQIARRHQTTVKALKTANGLDNDTIIAGATLKLPSA